MAHSLFYGSALKFLYDSFFFEKAIPSAGCIICCLMFLSPLTRVLRAQKEGTLGDLNPQIFPVMLANTAGWVGYSYLQRDIFVFVANLPGLLLGIFITMTSHSICTDTKVKARMVATTIFFTAVLSLLGFVTAEGVMTKAAQQFAWGITTNAILLIFYGAPLLSVVQVIQTRCSGPLIWQMSTMSLINSLLWVVYGLHLHLPFVWVPNAAGALLANLQLTLCLAYPKNRSALVKVDGLSAPLLVEGTIGDVEDAVSALEKVGIATRQHVISVQATAGPISV